jgi:hypothetical protein
MNINYFLRNFDDEIMAVAGSLIGVLSLLYLLPLIQALIAYEKTKWLERQFASSVSSGDAENDLRSKLLKASEPGQSYPIYKIFKFYFASIGISGIIYGLFIMLIPMDVLMDRDSIDWLLFLPLIIGVGLFFLYNTFFKGQGLWKEIAALSLFVGFLSTTLMAYGNFNMFEWLRTDILSFIILTVGWFIIYFTKSTFVSFLYMIVVAIAAAVVNFSIGYDWMYFLPHLLWVFGIAILYFWIPQLRVAKDIGPKEIIFGMLFMAMILTLTFTQTSGTSGLFMASLAIVLPGLYIFSKAYYQNATSIIGKPIELVVILIVVAMAAVLSVNMFMTAASDSISLFEYYSFHKQFAYFILLGLIGGIFYISNDLGDASEDINPLIAFFPLGAFIIAYIFGEYGGHYMMTVFLLGAGFLYVQKGIKKKDALRVGLGAMIFVYTIVIKVMDVLGEYIEGKFGVGLVLFMVGALFLGVVIYIRSKWTASSPMRSITSSEQKTDVINDVNMDSSN